MSLKQSVRRLLAIALALTMGYTSFAGPAAADPGTTIPDPGVRPVPDGPVQYPGTGNAPAPVVLGPLASQITNETIAVQALGEKLKQAELDLQAATEGAAAAERSWREANERVGDLRAKADAAASDAYKAAASLGPLGRYAGDLHQFSVLVPGLADQPGGPAAARELLRAEGQQRAAAAAQQAAGRTVADRRAAFDTLKSEFDKRSAALNDLKTRNAAEYARILAQQDAYEQSLGGANLAANGNADGMQAHPKALQAVAFALSKRGSPYVWGDEGPNTFDCSGLAYWAYKQVGATVPRVANAMYHGTPAIAVSRSSRGDLLLPGDLVFFASNPADWRSIYHMGIYIGEGRMVAAPTTGDVVKIASVSWSRLFGATRIFPAVPKPKTSSPTPSPTPHATPSTGPSPSNSPSPSAPPTSASPSPSPSPSMSVSASSAGSSAPASP